MNFDDLRINNICALGWVIRDSNGIIQLVGSRHLGNALIIIADSVVLRDGVPAAIYNGFTNLEIEGDSKVIINCYNRRSSSLVQLFYLWRIFGDFLKI